MTKNCAGAREEGRGRRGMSTTASSYHHHAASDSMMVQADPVPVASSAYHRPASALVRMHACPR
jgi:hypothetical protein